MRQIEQRLVPYSIVKQQRIYDRLNTAQSKAAAAYRVIAAPSNKWSRKWLNQQRFVMYCRKRRFLMAGIRPVHAALFFVNHVIQ